MTTSSEDRLIAIEYHRAAPAVVAIDHHWKMTIPVGFLYEADETSLAFALDNLSGKSIDATFLYFSAKKHSANSVSGDFYSELLRNEEGLRIFVHPTFADGEGPNVTYITQAALLVQGVNAQGEPQGFFYLLAFYDAFSHAAEESLQRFMTFASAIRLIDAPDAPAPFQ